VNSLEAAHSGLLPSTDFLLDVEAVSPLKRVAAERRRRPLTVFFGVLVGLMLAVTGSRWSAHSLVSELLFLTGVCLAAVGTLGRTWSNLFISGYKTKVLIQTGPYSMCRNPLYFFSAIGMVGIGLCSGTLSIPLMMIVFFAAYYPLIIRCEEQRLAETHGDDYEWYRCTTPAFWPQFASYQEPDTYTMLPDVMRKNIVDAFWFVALAAITHVLAHLHAIQVLPEFFQVW